jgi:hypothetical protein
MLYFIFMLLGILLYIVKDIIRWNKGTPTTFQPFTTFTEYCRLNFWALVGGLLLAVVFLSLGLKGELDIFEMMNIKPVLSYTAAFLIGVGAQATLKQWGGAVPSLEVKGSTIQ